MSSADVAACIALLCLLLMLAAALRAVLALRTPDRESPSLQHRHVVAAPRSAPAVVVSAPRCGRMALRHALRQSEHWHRRGLLFACAHFTRQTRLAPRSAATPFDAAVAAVRALCDKADALHAKGHIVRAAENYGRAADAARALGGGDGADNFAAVKMQLLQGHLLGAYAVTAPDAGVAPAAVAAHRAQAIALLCSTVGALERRRVAGTLLPGRCSAADAAWHGDCVRRGNAQLTAGGVASWAQQVGYDTFVQGAASVLDLLISAPRFAAECSEAQRRACMQHVVHAAELMTLPRGQCGSAGTTVEVYFSEVLRNAVAKTKGTRGPHPSSGPAARQAQQLASAWQRLQRSGVLEARGIAGGVRAMEHDARAFWAVVDAEAVAPGLRTCALQGCSAKEAHPAHFKSCAACKTAVYCCKAHQADGWAAHRGDCKAARKAAAAGSQAGA
jgi:hypothetical protein